MKTVELNDEPPIVPAHEHIRKERSTQKVKRIRFPFEEIPKELRKKEAGKPLYLIRYE